MQDGPTDLLPPGVPAADAVDEAGDDASDRVRARIEMLLAAARDLSDTCADLADALRPLPGAVLDDPLTMDFGRLRAERTAALLDEAASAARGTLGLLDAAYRALDQRTEPEPALGAATVLPAPRTEASTWPDAFVELPPRALPADEDVAIERSRAGEPDVSSGDAGPGEDEPDVTDGEPVRIAMAALAGWVVVDPDDETDTGTPVLPSPDAAATPPPTAEPAMGEPGAAARSGPAADVAEGRQADWTGNGGTAVDRQPAEPAATGWDQLRPNETDVDRQPAEPAASGWDQLGPDETDVDRQPAEPAAPAWDEAAARETDVDRQPAEPRRAPAWDEAVSRPRPT